MGSVICSGTTLPDVTNVLYAMNLDNEIKQEKRIFFNWEEVYELKKLQDPEEAEKYRLKAEKEIRKNGLMSEYIQTQYYCSFQVQGNRFVTLDVLREKDVFSLYEYGLLPEEIDKYSRNNNVYIIGALDTSLDEDYCTLIIGLIIVDPADKYSYSVEVREILIYNFEEEKITPEDIITKTVEYCKYFKLDALIIDGTAAQKDRAFYICKKLDAEKIGTMVVPYYYNQHTKGRLFYKLEELILDKKFKMPLETYKSQIPVYKEAIDELLYFQKNVTPSGYVKFSAPKTSGLHDDCVSCLGELAISYTYILECEETKKKAVYGAYEYFITLKKQTDARTIAEENIRALRKKNSLEIW